MGGIQDKIKRTRSDININTQRMEGPGRVSLPDANGMEELKETVVRTKKTEKKTVNEIKVIVPAEEIKVLPKQEDLKQEELQNQQDQQNADEDEKMPPLRAGMHMTPELMKRYKAVYTDNARQRKEEILKNAGYDVPGDLEELINIRSACYEKYDKVGVDGKTVVDYRWKEDVSQQIRDAFDWLSEYYKVNNRSLDIFQDDNSERMPVEDHKVNVTGLNEIYEDQGANNCYACTGSAMLNQFIRNRNGEDQAQRRFNQTDIRNYRPRIKKFREEYARRGFADRNKYEGYINEIDNYCGEGKHRVGNIFEMGDFFLDQFENNDVMINKMVFQVPMRNNREKDEIKSHNLKVAFKKRISEVLAGGNVVGLLLTSGKSGHYVTITGIDGDKIEYLNSGKLGDVTEPESTTVNEILERRSRGRTVEITYLSNMKTPEEMQREYSNVSYDEERGYSLKVLNEQASTDVSHVKGLAVSKEFYEMGPGMDGISEIAYIPNPKAVVESETIEEHKAALLEEREGKKEELKTGTVKKEEPVQKVGTVKKEEPVQKVGAVKKEEPVQKAGAVKKEETVQNVGAVKKEETEQKAKTVKTDEEAVQKTATVKKEGGYDWGAALREEVEKRREEALKKAGELEDVKNLIMKRQNSKSEMKKARKIAKKYEDKNKDYTTFGVGFSLKNVTITAADSGHMRRVKEQLTRYLKIRNEIFQRNGLIDKTATERLNGIEKHDPIELIQKSGRGFTFEGNMPAPDREDLGKAYDDLKIVVDDYLLERGGIFKSGRGKARLEQVRNIQKQLHVDNMRFFLSKNRRELAKSLDVKYDSDFENKGRYFFPTWMKAQQFSDKAELMKESYREERQNQREKGTLPAWYVRMGQWFTTGLKRSALRIMQAYNFLGGSIDRGLGLATMLAANAVELSGKVVKAPIKVLSSIFNFGSKYIARSNKRWKVKYSLGTGWKNLDDGRKIFRRYLKGACVLPVGVVEALYRGIPAIFGKKYKSGVFKHSGKWTNDILKDIGNVFKSIGFNKDYGMYERSNLDVEMAGGLYVDENGEVQKRDGYNKPGFRDSLAMGLTDSEISDDDDVTDMEDKEKKEKKEKKDDK